MFPKVDVWSGRFSLEDKSKGVISVRVFQWERVGYEASPQPSGRGDQPSILTCRSQVGSPRVEEEQGDMPGTTGIPEMGNPAQGG